MRRFSTLSVPPGFDQQGTLQAIMAARETAAHEQKAVRGSEPRSGFAWPEAGNHEAPKVTRKGSRPAKKPSAKHALRKKRGGFFFLHRSPNSEKIMGFILLTHCPLLVAVHNRKLLTCARTPCTMQSSTTHHNQEKQHERNL
jgi:hypothetical protein